MRGEAGTEVGVRPDHASPAPEGTGAQAGLPSREDLVTPLSLTRLALYSASIVLGAVLVCCLLACAVVLAVAAVQGREGLDDVLTQYRFDLALRARVGAAILSAFYASLALATLALAHLLDRRGGWRRRLALRPIKPGRGRTFLLSVLTLLYAALATLSTVSGQAPRLVDAGPTDVVLLATLLTNLCLLAPVAEELLFRGWLYTGLRARLPFWPAYLATAALFVTIHWYASAAHMVRVVPLALVLGLVREWKDSIKPTMALHAVYNITIVAITLART